jgi:3-deoxy-7-phosphoheptulonate synthase
MPVGQLSHASRSWDPGVWRELPAEQQPTWPDRDRLRQVTARLAASPPLVSPPEVHALRGVLDRVARGGALIVQAGDCAETLDGPYLADVAAKVRLVEDMAREVADASGLPVVRIGRIAGQYAKPRSSPTEWAGHQELPSFRGYLVNSPEPRPASRVPDPARLLRGYQHARATLRMLRQVRSPAAAQAAREPGGLPAVWTSHEALVLDYEEPLVRHDPATGGWVLTSTHLPWIGVRTSATAGAHVAFLSGVANPVGCKVGPAATPAGLVELCRRLDPRRAPGRLVLICRLGAERVRQLLPHLVAAVADAGHPVVWLCDPMHGNTRSTRDGRKTRHLDAVLAELRGFFAAVRTAGGWPGGVHLEATVDDVTECLGGIPPVTQRDLARRYTTVCDPRLNPHQSQEVARRVAELCRTRRTGAADERQA